uniref:methylmalonyl-CoA mutase family protein n=1 Tax=Winogradskyella poriferorum TaxID=307627 RepID=UPI003D64F693
HFRDKLSENDKASIKIAFTSSIGSNYFFEIAKLWALRSLWSVLAVTFVYNQRCRIIAIPSARNKKIYDY